MIELRRNALDGQPMSKRAETFFFPPPFRVSRTRTIFGIEIPLSWAGEDSKKEGKHRLD
jgi:hypothetical protein